MQQREYWWQRYQEYLYRCPELGLALDISRMNFSRDFFPEMEPRMQKAYQEMEELEKGALANPDEGRMVGHYWLRAPERAPGEGLSEAIRANILAIRDFARRLQRGEIRSQGGAKFSRFLLIGIGGSALGPQLMADALPGGAEALKPYFLDNTDPDGIDRVLGELGDALAETLVLVASKSGGTVETKNGMLEVRQACCLRGLDFAKQAVALTMEGSLLDKLAREENWLARFPIWDWVGGRTSVTSAVGLLPAALQGMDIDGFLQGAQACDTVTRGRDTLKNPAALLALMWYYATGGRSSRDMVILPYKDSLRYLARYLQQLVMESLGKEENLAGEKVHQGLSVYGNKGSTDQHAYVQQLLDGVNNFFVLFVVVLQSRRSTEVYVEEKVTSGDYLQAFFLGTRQALTDKGRESLTISLERLDAFTLGALLALFERAVGFYASLININAYHQPGVELGKKVARRVIELQGGIVEYLQQHPEQAFGPREVAQAAGFPDEEETAYLILEYLATDGKRGIYRTKGSLPYAPGYYYKYTEYNLKNN